MKKGNYHTKNEFVAIVGRARKNVKVPVVLYEGNSHQRRMTKRFLMRNQDLLLTGTII